jgi:hypothetical protein
LLGSGFCSCNFGHRKEKHTMLFWIIAATLVAVFTFDAVKAYITDIF